MELSAFIEQSMVEVARGVRKANASVRKEAKGGPKNLITLLPGQGADRSGSVFFDVAVQPGEQSGIEVYRADKGSAAASVSRLGFTLRVASLLA